MQLRLKESKIRPDKGGTVQDSYIDNKGLIRDNLRLSYQGLVQFLTAGFGTHLDKTGTLWDFSVGQLGQYRVTQPIVRLGLSRILQHTTKAPYNLPRLECENLRLFWKRMGGFGTHVDTPE